MKLIKIRAIGFQGDDFSYDLAAITLLIGRNFRGKTRVLNAIQVLLLGYLPALGKENKATFTLASGTAMTIEGTFDTGQVMTRAFTLRGNTVSMTLDGPKEITDYDQMAVMLNAEEYLARSDRSRVEYVFAHVAMGDAWTGTGIHERLEAKLLPAGEQWPAEKLQAVNTVLTAMNTDASKCEAVQEWVDEAIESVTNSWKGAKASAVQMEKTIQGLANLRAADEDPLQLSTLEDERAVLQRGITDLTERRGRYLGSFTAMKAAQVRREEIERELRHGDKTRQQMLDAKHKLALISQAIVDASPLITGDDLRTHQTLLGDAKQRVAEIDRQRLEQQARVNQGETELAALDGQTRCPYCAAEGTEWKKLRAAEYAKQIDEAKEQVALLAEAGRVAAGIYRHHQESGIALHDKHKLQARMREDLRAAESQLAKLEPSVSRLGAMAEELAKLLPNDPMLTASVDVLQSEINIKNDEARATDRLIKEAAGRVSELKRLAQAERDRDAAKLEQEVAAAAGKELRVIQSEMVEAAFKPLLDRANSFFAHVLRSPLIYRDKEIGMVCEGHWVPHHTFSGTEKALTYAALQAALAAQSPVRLMMIDELGRLDGVTADKMIHAVMAAVWSGQLDGFIGIDTGRADFWSTVADSSFKIIEIS